MFDQIINWEFLDEPAWRWFIFLGALLLMMWTWRGIVDFMK